MILPLTVKLPVVVKLEIVEVAAEKVPVVVMLPTESMVRVPVPTVKPALAKTGALNSLVPATVNLSEAVEPIVAEPPTPKLVIPAEPETPREEKMPAPPT